MKAALPLLAYLVALLLASQIPSGLPTPSSTYNTVPAFLWSPHYHQVKAAINYQTISPKDLAKSVLSEGGWSNLLCPSNDVHQPLDLALVFVGTELQSSDISASKHADPALVNLLKVSFTQSNFSMAFPYIAASEKDAMESSLVSGMSEICGQNFGFNNVRFSESCSMDSDNVQKLSDLHSVHVSQLDNCVLHYNFSDISQRSDIFFSSKNWTGLSSFEDGEKIKWGSRFGGVLPQRI
ncbi:hypothetical protein ABKV19_002555 [Rosa sericea]